MRTARANALNSIERRGYAVVVATQVSTARQREHLGNSDYGEATAEIGRNADVADPLYVFDLGGVGKVIDASRTIIRIHTPSFGAISTPGSAWGKAEAKMAKQ